MFNTKPQIYLPGKVSCFEFLLDTSLLESHLDQDNPEPSATELLINILSNFPSPWSNQSNDIENNGKPTFPTFSQADIHDENFIDEMETGDELESKKNQALKLLALKIAAFLKWDLDLLQKALPLHVQQVLLWELLKVTGNEIKGKNVLRKNRLYQLTPDGIFARILYSMWILQTAMDSQSPKYRRRTDIQILGQTDSAGVSPAVGESIMKRVNEEREDAVAALEECFQDLPVVRLPLLRCFMCSSDESCSPSYRWDQGSTLQNDEVICQVSYNLGRFYFFQDRYQQASQNFIQASNLYEQCQNSIFCKLNRSKLQGFCDACASLLQFNTANAPIAFTECLVAPGNPDTGNMPKSDNVGREPPLALRDSLEMDVLRGHLSNAELHLKDYFLNVLRRIVDGKIVATDWRSILKTNEEQSSIIFCELLTEVIPTCSQRQRLFLKKFVGSLCLISAPARVLLKKSNLLSQLLSQEETQQVFCHDYQPSKHETFKLENNYFTNDPLVEAGLLEGRLLSTTDPNSVKLLVTQLCGKFGQMNLCSLSKYWNLPTAVPVFLNSVPGRALSTADVEMVQIFVAKINELRAIKKYEEAQNLCRTINREIQNGIPGLSRYLAAESLRLDLLKILDEPVHSCPPASARTEIVQRILEFLECHDNREPYDAQILELCAAVLLNFREWDKIIGLRPGFGCYFEIAKVISVTCRELCVGQASKNTSKDLWDLVLPMFLSMRHSHKRSHSGVIKDATRENSQAIMTRFAFQAFVRLLKDTSSLGVIISCLGRLYNILKDNSTDEIYLEYNELWPSTITNSGTFNKTFVSEDFQSALCHALSVHPMQSAWLRTNGDVMYAQSHYSSALKFYVSAAMVSTDYFYQALPKVLFDDQMFTHMIHCCTKLQNHTQSVILHQFLEQPNYQDAFKALCNRVCHDSCDTYYSYIWDVTLLEFLINFHSTRGELKQCHLLLQLVGQPELNDYNNDEIQREAASLRQRWFLRAMAKQFL